MLKNNQSIKFLIFQEFELKGYAKLYNIDLESYLSTIVGDTQALSILCKH